MIQKQIVEVDIEKKEKHDMENTGVQNYTTTLTLPAKA